MQYSIRYSIAHTLRYPQNIAYFSAYRIIRYSRHFHTTKFSKIGQMLSRKITRIKIYIYIVSIHICKYVYIYIIQYIYIMQYNNYYKYTHTIINNNYLKNACYVINIIFGLHLFLVFFSYLLCFFIIFHLRYSILFAINC